jgi:hypothetical protein
MRLPRSLADVPAAAERGWEFGYGVMGRLTKDDECSGPAGRGAPPTERLAELNRL